MSDFQPPPTWAEPVLVDEKTLTGTFHPVWLKWFIDLTRNFDASGTIAGSGAITTSGYTMSTNRLLGRTTAGTGAVEEISVTANVGLLFTAGALSIDNATQADMESPTSGNKQVISTRVLYHPGVVKAHCKFDPTGTISGPSYNIGSITDHGVGDWTVNISGSFPLSSSDGTILLTVDHSAPLIPVVNARTSASAYRIRCYDLAGVLTDPTYINFAILGDCS